MHAASLATVSTRPIPGQGSMSALVIDDSVIDRYLICHALADACPDLRVAECATAGDARRWLDGHAPDMIFADRILPDGDGADVALGAAGDVAVVILSGEDCPDIGPRIDARARSVFLHKDDLSPVTLRQSLARILRPAAPVIPLRPDAGSAIAALSTPSGELARGLRLLRMMRLQGSSIGPEERAELLQEVEAMIMQPRLPD
ncbi:hypothetical protein ATO6_11900 [Oceanicola sp. 22II-s10i]|uniref:response regulator n=1 Tax=Oceanicola sp. 22II-s10i TaxID=1317116 RepID=UPI000B528443|nr:response regulator [Oceanicola sp. 22II-s10i]OWU84407.1 hypothetical protein ATO6_11900 [Oceanicola sp. 22II-s10i]